MSSRTDFGLTRDGIVQLRRRWSAGSPRAAVLLLHGIAEHSGRYEHVGEHLAGAGFEVIAIDHRGFGLSGGRRAYVASFGEFLDDVEDQLAEVRALGLPTVMLGHSMGGLIALSYVLERRPAPDALALSGPALGANVPVVLRALVPVLNRIAPRLRVPTPIKGCQLATDPRVGEAYFADPLVVRTSTPALGHAMLSQVAWANAHLAELDGRALPTLVQHGADDSLVPAASTVALGAMTGVQRIAYPGLRHEIFNEPSSPAVLDDLVGWLDTVL